MVDGFYITLVTRLTDDGFHVGLDAWKTLKVGINIKLSGLSGNAQIIGQAKVRNSIDHSKVDGLGIATVIWGHIFGILDVKDPHSRCCVDVFTALKGFNQMLVLGNVGQNSQLNLRIIRGQKDTVLQGRHKGLANEAALF